jgi:hypothetical protein
MSFIYVPSGAGSTLGTVAALQATVSTGLQSVVVNHGQPFTPLLRDIVAMPLSDLIVAVGIMTAWWVSGITATQFTLNLDSPAINGPIDFGFFIRKH